MVHSIIKNPNDNMLYWLYMAPSSHKMFSPTSCQTQSDQHDWLINFDWLIRFMITLFRRQSRLVVLYIIQHRKWLAIPLKKTVEKLTTISIAKFDFTWAYASSVYTWIFADKFSWRNKVNKLLTIELRGGLRDLPQLTGS